MKSKKKLLITIFILAVCFISSCSSNNKDEIDVLPTPAATPTPEVAESVSIEKYFPLKVGNTWTYQGEGNEYASFTQWVLYSEDNKYQLMMDNSGTVMANVIQVNKDSVINIYREAEVYNEKNVLNEEENTFEEVLKTPIEVGNNWISEKNEYEIVEIDASITVPAGKFNNCIAVSIVFEDGSRAMTYYKEGVGLIQSDFYLNDTDVISSKLKEYKLN